MGMPDQVHVVAGDEEGLGVLLLEVEIHPVAPDTVRVELWVRIVGEGHLRTTTSFKLSKFDFRTNLIVKCSLPCGGFFDIVCYF